MDDYALDHWLAARAAASLRRQLSEEGAGVSIIELFSIAAPISAHRQIRSALSSARVVLGFLRFQDFGLLWVLGGAAMVTAR